MSPPERPPDARPDVAGKSGEDHRPVIEVFIDRSLGRRHLAQTLGDLGFMVHTMASVYGERVAQELDDERWLADLRRLHQAAVALTDRPARGYARTIKKVSLVCPWIGALLR